MHHHPFKQKLCSVKNVLRSMLSRYAEAATDRPMTGRPFKKLGGCFLKFATQRFQIPEVNRASQASIISHYEQLAIITSQE